LGSSKRGGIKNNGREWDTVKQKGRLQNGQSLSISIEERTTTGGKNYKGWDKCEEAT